MSEVIPKKHLVRLFDITYYTTKRWGERVKIAVTRLKKELSRQNHIENAILYGRYFIKEINKNCNNNMHYGKLVPSPDAPDNTNSHPSHILPLFDVPSWCSSKFVDTKQKRHHENIHMYVIFLSDKALAVNEISQRECIYYELKRGEEWVHQTAVLTMLAILDTNLQRHKGVQLQLLVINGRMKAMTL